MFRVIVAGSRSFTDFSYANHVLQRAFVNRKPSSIVCGMASGADSIGLRWAQLNQIPVDKFPAEWQKFGKSAGYKRNVQMAENAEALVAFWDGESSGTKHMINIALEHGLPIILVNYKEKTIHRIKGKTE